MEILKTVLDFFLHLDVHLAQAIAQYGSGTYALLFLIVFCETGLIVLPILPGDSLLFAAGALAAIGSLQVTYLIPLLFFACLLGDLVNYSVGKFLGEKLFRNPNSRIFKKSYLEKTQEFYFKHGPKTIILARFIPIVRTFAPFVAGMGKMPFRKFIAFSLGGAALWVMVCIGFGYLFGNIPVVKANFTLVIVAIIFISILPGLIGILRARQGKV